MSWQQLEAISRERLLDYENDRNDPPIACPNDGTPLVEDPHGGLRCNFDGWRWPADPDPLHPGI